MTPKLWTIALTLKSMLLLITALLTAKHPAVAEPKQNSFDQPFSLDSPSILDSDAGSGLPGNFGQDYCRVLPNRSEEIRNSTSRRLRRLCRLPWSCGEWQEAPDVLPSAHAALRSPAPPCSSSSGSPVLPASSWVRWDLSSLRQLPRPTGGDYAASRRRRSSTACSRQPVN